jgi:hypothetical protein
MKIWERIIFGFIAEGKAVSALYCSMADMLPLAPVGMRLLLG